MVLETVIYLIHLRSIPASAISATLRLCEKKGIIHDREWIENEITGRIVDAAYKIHSSLGPGLLKSVYELLMVHELEKRGLKVARQQGIPFVYEGVKFNIGFRADLVVENKVLVELKSIETFAPVHRKQLLTYLRLDDKRVGLLINFGAAFIKDGIIRVVNNLKE